MFPLFPEGEAAVTVDADAAARYSTRHGVLTKHRRKRGTNLMQHITAIGFDLFETLVIVENLRREEAVGRLLRSLKSSGLALAEEAFFRSIAPPPGGL